MIKVLQIISNTNKSLAFEIIAKGLKENHIDIVYVLLQDKESDFSLYLKFIEIKYFILPIKGKIDKLKTALELFILIKKMNPDIVHTHLREANLLGLTIAKILFVKNRVYTRHHSTYNIEYHPSAVKWDKLVNRFATHIISISNTVTNVLTTIEGVSASKILLIEHGFDINSFKNINNDKILKLKLKYNIREDAYPVIGVISRFIHLKGLQYIIPAFNNLKNIYPNAFFIFANAIGRDASEINKLIKQNLNLDDYIQIEFEDDLYHLYALFDIFVHVPVNKNIEAFGQTYIEALAANVPSVFTLSGIANDVIDNEYNALVVNHQSSSEIFIALRRLIEDKNLREKIKINGYKTALLFSGDIYVEKHLNLYKQICHLNDKK